MQKPLLITAKNAATMVGRTPRTLFNWALNPETGFPPVIVVRGARFYEAEAVQAWIKAQIDKTQPPAKYRGPARELSLTE